MVERSFLFTSLTLILSSICGCSSSSNNPPAIDAGANNGTPDGATLVTSDSSTTGYPGDDSSTTDNGDCPGPVSPNDDIPVYAATVATPGACSPSEIAGWIANCLDPTSDCDNWNGTKACQNCLAPFDNNDDPLNGGPQLTNETTGDQLLNTPGCVAIEDPTNGAACAAPLAAYYQCKDVACYNCDSDTSAQSCGEAAIAPGGVCATYYTAATSACAADLVDGGVANFNNGECQDPTFVFTLYCGGGDGGASPPPDGGSSDDGGGGSDGGGD